MDSWRSHTLVILLFLSHQLFLSRPFCNGWGAQANMTAEILQGIVSVCMYMDLVNMPSSPCISSETRRCLKSHSTSGFQEKGARSMVYLSACCPGMCFAIPVPGQCSGPCFSGPLGGVMYRQVSLPSAPCLALHFSHCIPCISNLISSVKSS